MNQEGFIVEVNRKWLEKLGYKRGDVLGHWFGEFLTPESREDFMNNFSRLKAEGKVSGLKLVVFSKDGSRLDLSFTGRVSYDEDGNFKQTHFIFQDITKQLKVEKALKESENYYKAIFENRGAATIIIEEDDTISLMNAAIEGALTAEAREISRNHKLGTYTVEIRDDNGEMVAIFQGLAYIKNHGSFIRFRSWKRCIQHHSQRQNR